MIENIKLISNIYAVKQFHNIFWVYCKILAPFLVITFLLGLISMNPQIFESGLLEPYLSFLLIAITSSVIIFAPYFLYILYVEKKKKWILSFFIFVVIPFILAYMIFKQYFFYMMGAYFPVLFYGIYCLILKAQVQKWLDRYHREQAKLDAKKDKEEIKINLPF